MTKMTTADPMADFCQICHTEISRAEHRAAELAGQFNHGFSADGSLTLSEPPRPKTEPGTRMVIANAVDVQLRELLIAKGILSAEDFAAPGMPG